MASTYLTRTRPDRAQLIVQDGVTALDRHAALTTMLRDKVGGDAAALFATPLISRGNDEAPMTISWYTDLIGEPRPLSELDGLGRSRVETRLAETLARLRPLLSDPQVGPMVGAAMHLAGPGALWTVGDRPVLVDWGLTPAPDDAAAGDRQAAFARTLGRFLPLATVPPLSTGEQSAQGWLDIAPTEAAKSAPEPAPAAPEVPAAPVTPVSAVSGPEPEAPQPVAVAPSRGAWILLGGLLLFALLVLLWLLWPGTRQFPPRVQLDAPEAQALLSEGNRALERRADQLQDALDGMVCRDDGTLLMPDGRTPQGLLPPGPATPGDGGPDPTDRDGTVPGDEDGAAIPPDSLIPPDPGRVEVPPVAGEEEQDARTLISVIEAQTVLVIASGGGGNGGHGTGFFIGPDLVVTNHHVVTGGSDMTLYVTNADLGRVREAELISAGGPFDSNGQDFAVLRVPGADQPFFELADAGETLTLQNIVAAGYPGDVMSSDTNFRELLSGNAEAVPSIVVTEGIVTTEQSGSFDSNIILHSASLSQGNSGGPSIDMCGRVIGVNTFIRREDNRVLNIALAVPDLRRFLDSAGVSPRVTDAPCAPRLAPSAPPPRATPEEEAPSEAEPEPATPDRPREPAPGDAPPVDPAAPVE